MLKMSSILLLTVSLFLSGCTARLADFTVLSTKNNNVPAKTIGKRVTGEDCIYAIWFVHFSEPSMKDAFDRAMEAAGPDFDALIDTTIYQKIGLIKTCIMIKGLAVNTKTAKAPAP